VADLNRNIHLVEGEVLVTVAVQLFDDSRAQTLIGRQARAPFLASGPCRSIQTASADEGLARRMRSIIARFAGLFMAKLLAAEQLGFRDNSAHSGTFLLAGW